MKQRFCPNCGTRNVEPDFRRTNMLGELISNQNQWLCNECGYAGWMPEGDPEDHNEDTGDIEFDEKDQPTIDDSMGKAYGKYLVYIAIPFTIVYILLRLLIG